jgi:hypothetical protein
VVVYVIVPALMVVAIVAGWWWSDDARTRRRLRAAPRVPIAETHHMTLVRVRGRIRAADEVLRAPLTGRRCVYYLARVRQRKGVGSGTEWEEVIREERGVDFVLVDESGETLVHMDAAQVAIVVDRHSRSGAFDDANPVEQVFLMRHGLDSTGSLGQNLPMAYEEGALECDEEVTVLGQVFVDGAKGRYPRVLQAPPDQPLLVTDDLWTVRAR